MPSISSPTASRAWNTINFHSNSTKSRATYFAREADIVGGQTGADMKAHPANPPDPAALARLSAIPYYNARMRTTCVATRLDGGHANNALPGMAHANVNCRILPGHSPDEIEATLVKVLADPQHRGDARARYSRPAAFRIRHRRCGPI